MLFRSDGLPEITFAGRSNVGKSSLFNTLVNRKKLARVSQSPGKTRTINFYVINDRFRIVDLPGYGYAKVSKSVSQQWGPMIEKYLASRSELVKVVQLVDSRHEPSKQDVRYPRPGSSILRRSTDQSAGPHNRSPTAR